MSIKTEAKQNIEKLTGSAPFQAAAGASDLAAEKLRKVQERLASLDLQATLAGVPQRLAGVGERAQATLSTFPEKIAALRAKDPKEVQEAVQAKAKQVPERAQDLAVQVAGFAVQTYGELAERGRTLVGRSRASEQQPEPYAGEQQPAEQIEQMAEQQAAAPAAAKPAKKTATSKPRTGTKATGTRSKASSKPSTKAATAKND